MGLSALNDAAEHAGLKPHMALADARAILPSLTVHPAEPTADGKMLERLAQWCGRYSPWVSMGSIEKENDPTLSLEGAGGAGIWLDATGCAHLFGDEKAMLADMATRIEKLGFTARIAMADTLGCAWAVARFATNDPPWRTVPSGNTCEALAPLAITALRLPPATVLALHEVGLRYIEDLLDMPRGPLAARFEKEVRLRLDAALGKSAEPLSPILPTVPLVSRLTFAEPIGHRGDIAAATRKLLEKLCAILEKQGQGARQLVLSVYRPDGSTARVTVGTARSNREPDHLLRLFAEHLDEIDPEFGIDEMTLFAAVAGPMEVAQTSLQRGAAIQSTDRFNAVVDRLTNRLGPGSVRQARFRESHIPERAAGFGPVDRKDAEQTDQENTDTPRPLRLLRPPEEIEAVAESTDGPPLLFRWRRVLHRIQRCEGPERIAPEWWCDDNNNTRDYYRVENETGQRFWLFRNSETSWYIHGLFG